MQAYRQTVIGRTLFPFRRDPGICKMGLNGIRAVRLSGDDVNVSDKNVRENRFGPVREDTHIVTGIGNGLFDRRENKLPLPSRDNGVCRHSHEGAGYTPAVLTFVRPAPYTDIFAALDDHVGRKNI